MKKVLLVLLMCLLLTGCVSNRRVVGSRNIIRTNYGSYIIPYTWEKSVSHSNSYKYFFTNKKDRNKNQPNNISVEKGTNKYSKDDHIAFRQAIQRQLLMQTKGYADTVKGSGGTTKNGYIYYTFIMEGKTQSTIQHYIIGDYKYVLVHETIFEGDGKDTHNAAKTIVNSFKWDE